MNWWITWNVKKNENLIKCYISTEWLFCPKEMWKKMQSTDFRVSKVGYQCFQLPLEYWEHFSRQWLINISDSFEYNNVSGVSFHHLWQSRICGRMELTCPYETQCITLLISFVRISFFTNARHTLDHFRIETFTPYLANSVLHLWIFLNMIHELERHQFTQYKNEDPDTFFFFVWRIISDCVNEWRSLHPTDCQCVDHFGIEVECNFSKKYSNGNVFFENIRKLNVHFENIQLRIMCKWIELVTTGKL